MNAAENLLSLEEDYSAYMAENANSVLKMPYDSFINVAENIYREYSETPPTYDNDDVVITASPMDMSLYYGEMYNETVEYQKSDASDYLTCYIQSLYTRLLDLEFCIWYTIDSEAEVYGSDSDTDGSTLLGRVSNSEFMYEHWYASASDNAMADIVEQLQALIGFKSNFASVAAEALTSDADLKTYQEFVDEAERLTNILAANPPTGGDRSYFENQDFNLDDLEELYYKLSDAMV